MNPHPLQRTYKKKSTVGFYFSGCTGGKFQYSPMCELKRELFECVGLSSDSVENHTNKGKIKCSIITCCYIFPKGNKRHCLMVVMIPG